MLSFTALAPTVTELLALITNKSITTRNFCNTSTCCPFPVYHFTHPGPCMLSTISAFKGLMAKIKTSEVDALLYLNSCQQSQTVACHAVFVILCLLSPNVTSPRRLDCPWHNLNTTQTPNTLILSRILRSAPEKTQKTKGSQTLFCNKNC